jgi:hypothetical protein
VPCHSRLQLTPYHVVNLQEHMILLLLQLSSIVFIATPTQVGSHPQQPPVAAVAAQHGGRHPAYMG